jgi:hypothetical protein
MVSSGYGLRAARFRAPPPRSRPRTMPGWRSTLGGLAHCARVGVSAGWLANPAPPAPSRAFHSSQQAGARLVRRTIPSYRTYDAYHEVVRYM